MARNKLSSEQLIVLIVSFIVLVVGYLPLHAFAAFLVPAAQEFGVGRANFAAVISLYWIVRAVSAPLVGLATDRLGAWQIIALASLLFVAALITASRTSSLLGLYATYGIGVGLAVGAMTNVPTSALLRFWFSRRLGAALGIVSTGMAGGLILLPLITTMVERYDWRSTLVGMGLAILVILGITLGVGLKVAGNPTNVTSSSASHFSRRSNISPQEALALPSFWLLFGAVFFGPITYHLPLIHQIAYLGDFGYTATQAGTVAALVGISSVFGRLAAGTISDSIGRSRTYTACALLVSAALLILFLNQGNSMVVVLVYAICLGVGYGAFAPLHPAASADLFGGKHYGTIFSFLYVAVALGGALGAWVPGKIYDMTHSYQPALVIAMITILASAWLFDRAQRKHVEPLALGVR